MWSLFVIVLCIYLLKKWTKRWRIFATVDQNIYWWQRFHIIKKILTLKQDNDARWIFLKHRSILIVRLYRSTKVAQKRTDNSKTNRCDCERSQTLKDLSNNRSWTLQETASIEAKNGNFQIRKQVDRTWTCLNIFFELQDKRSRTIVRKDRSICQIRNRLRFISKQNWNDKTNKTIREANRSIWNAYGQRQRYSWIVDRWWCRLIKDVHRLFATCDTGVELSMNKTVNVKI